MGSHYPTRIHSRDAGYPNFVTVAKPDGSTLCGGLVSGPYSRDSEDDGPVPVGTDVYTNDRQHWRSSESAVDYSSSIICALMGYAALPDEPSSSCDARTAFAGRSVAAISSMPPKTSAAA